MEPSEAARQQVGQIFRYLQALNALRNPVLRQVKDQPWSYRLGDLPQHEAVRLEVALPEDSEEATQAYTGVFRLIVGKARVPAVPRPPASIEPWLPDNWDREDQAVTVRESITREGSDGDFYELRFDADAERVLAFREWSATHAAWARMARPARAALKLFERLYELHGHLEREGERLELVLGDGILNWRVSGGGVHHPVMLQRIQLTFDPRTPEFILSERDHASELYTSLISLLDGVDGGVLRRLRDEFEAGGYHPLGEEDTAGFLRGLVNSISSNGAYVDEELLTGERDYPRIGRDPVIFARDRKQGVAPALEAINDGLQRGAEIPISLAKIAGIHSGSSPLEGWQSQSGPEIPVLLSKPANPEQVKIAEELGRHGAVIVQGPPGTGKTHTIANLIGHLLAQGKTVLVTSHTSKALKRVRDQLDEPIRALCVSLLGSDAEGAGELKGSIEHIASAIASKNAQALAADAGVSWERRAQSTAKLQQAEGDLLDAVAGEYSDIVLEGASYTPSEAARLVAAEKEAASWIPSSVKTGAPLPLSLQELLDLYQTNELVSEHEERELSGSLPPPGTLPTPEAFTSLVRRLHELQATDLDAGKEYWSASQEPLSESRLRALRDAIEEALKPFADHADWKREIIESGRLQGAHRDLWTGLLRLIQQVSETAATTQHLLIAHTPALASGVSVDEQATLLTEIVDHLEGGGSLGSLTLLRHGNWKRLIPQLQVQGRRPQHLEEFQALRDHAALLLQRRQLLSRWQQMVTARGGIDATTLGDRPERILASLSSEVHSLLVWYERVMRPLATDFAAVGFHWENLLRATPTDPVEHAELVRLRNALTRAVSLVDARTAKVALASLEWELQEVLEGLSRFTGAVVQTLEQAVRARDASTYREAHASLVRIHGQASNLARRSQLLATLRPVAPAWAHAVEHRIGVHGHPSLPGDPKLAWRWRQLHDELERRALVSIDEIQRQIEQLKDDTLSATRDLVENKAWAALLQRLEHEPGKKQALVGWLHVMRRIGKGTGKRAPALKLEAQALMRQCREAVPVWVMPLTQVVESFDPLQTRFDVVIIDEASQVDVMGLIALFMAREVVIVGDHEQVSPTAVGEKVEEVKPLIDTYLWGIPNAKLYDGKLSVYHLAQQAFGGVIALREHFRCVPEIIQFSNHLSYDGRILPLRDAAQVALKPHVIAHRVEGALTDNKVNRKEADEICSLIVAATEQPEYRGKSMGVISLLGAEQAAIIEQHLKSRLDEVTYRVKHNIQCGNPAQFQGDERDVMFLSMVYTARGVPLSLMEADMYKQRFNVAASRARDQMWVVHSLDPRTELKGGDLRKRLIEHAEDPGALMRLLEANEDKTDSEFERQVLHRLLARGYRVVPQWKVGAFRIDLVVVGPDGKKLAVECDGDRFHPPSKLSEDMARQAILERLGWRFVRIRGSVFFRDPVAAMVPVFKRLDELDIRPVGLEAGDGANAATASEPSGQELIERVIRRAAELRREWASSDSMPDMAPSYVPSSPIPVSEAPAAEPFPAATPGSLPTPSSTPDTTPQLGFWALPMPDSIPPAASVQATVDGPNVLKALQAVLPVGVEMEREDVLRLAAAQLGQQLTRGLRSQINKAIFSARWIQTLDGNRVRRR